MDCLVSIPDRDSFELMGGDEAYAIKHRLICFNPFEGLFLRPKIIA
jgi:hypothetical protein